jgi:hypothetical protein
VQKSLPEILGAKTSSKIPSRIIATPKKPKKIE